MYKINTLFSISNYLLAINRTQQLSQIEAKKKKKKHLGTGQPQMPGETAVQIEKNRDKSCAKKYSTNSLLQLGEFWKRDHIGLANRLLCPLQMWEARNLVRVRKCRTAY